MKKEKFEKMSKKVKKEVKLVHRIINNPELREQLRSSLRGVSSEAKGIKLQIKPKIELLKNIQKKYGHLLKNDGEKRN